MLNIRGPGSLKKMVGLFDGGIKKIPDLLFARKHLTQEKEPQKVKELKS